MQVNGEDIAKSFQEIVVEVLYDKVLKAVNKKSVNTLLVAGGVSANKRLRKKFEELPENIKIYFPKMEYCTDNGAMIAGVGYRYLERGDTSPWNTTASARVSGFKKSALRR